MSKKMKAAVLVDTGKIEIKENDIPEIKDDEVLIKVKYAGVCGSDLHLFKGKHPFRKPPVVLGHEVVGDVVEIGKNVNKFKLGDKVTIEPHKGCGHCEYCEKGLVNLCLNKSAPGTGYWTGTFVEYFNAPEKYVHKVKDEASYESAVLAEPAAVSIHALNRFESHGDTLTIIGMGSIGLLALKVAKSQNLYKNIICVDLDEFTLKEAKENGADYIINPSKESMVEKVLSITNNEGCENILLSTGYPKILTEAGKIAKKRGQIVLVAMITDDIPYYSYDLVFKELKLIGAMTYTSKDFEEAIELINNDIGWESFVTKKYPIDESQDALELLRDRTEDTVKILIDMNLK